MRTIYIDAEHICHANDAEGRQAIETDAFDNLPDIALKYFIFVPKGKIYKDVACADDFIQCTNDTAISAAATAYEQSEAEHTAEIAELVEMIYTNDMGVINNA